MLFEWHVYESAIRVTFNVGLFVVLTSLVVFLGHFASNYFRDIKNSLVFFAMVLCIVSLGAFTGYAGGNSRNGVVGDVLPAVLAFISGGALYYLGLEKLKNAVAPIILTCFVFSLIFGFALGAKKRSLNEAKLLQTERRFSTCVLVFADPDILGSSAALKNAKEIFGRKCSEDLDGMNTQQ